MDEIKIKLRKFAKERNWDQFHSPKNLVMALSGEVGELTEVFQWLKDEESEIENLDQKTLEKAKEEIADVFLYLLRLSDKLNIDLIKEAELKLITNGQKYPISKSRGNFKKYNEL